MKKIISKCETFARLIEDPEALICKGIDRYHNLITVEELPEENIVKNVICSDNRLLSGRRRIQQVRFLPDKI